MEKKKWIIIFLVITLFAFIMPMTSSADQDITIVLKPNNPYMTVNGVQQEIDPGRGTEPVIIPKWGRTVVPIRAIVEALGGTIGWDGKERKVTINFNDTVINLWIDNPKAKVNGETKWIDENNHDVKPIIVNSRTMLPLRFVAENLGCKVEWNASSRTITIKYHMVTPPPLIQFKGNSDSTTDMFSLRSGIAVFDMHYRGDSNFSVELLDKKGSEVDLLANEIGNYSGTKAIGAYVDNVMGATPGKYLMNITGKGEWNVIVSQPTPEAIISLPHTFKGKGDNITPFFNFRSGLTKFEFNYKGEGNFIVTLIAEDGHEYSMANEIGDYTGSKSVGVQADNIFDPTPGVYLMSVTGTDGTWSIAISQ